jgi:hypothetical protein
MDGCWLFFVGEKKAPDGCVLEKFPWCEHEGAVAGVTEIFPPVYIVQKWRKWDDPWTKSNDNA